MWIVKQCVSEIKGLILLIVYKSLTEGYFPKSLESAVVKPTLKESNLDKDDFCNYCSVSNLSYLSKIIKKCVYNQLVTYLDQHAHSCETAIVKIHNDLMMMIDKRSNVLLILLDLSAAFYTINHAILLQRFKNLYGITGTVLNWMKSYLDGRNFTVTVRKVSSSSCVLEIGVPHRSILGPLLFILYTTDLERIEKSMVLQYIYMQMILKYIFI